MARRKRRLLQSVKRNEKEKVMAKKKDSRLAKAGKDAIRRMHNRKKKGK